MRSDLTMCELPAVFRQQDLKAKKRHRCCECGGTIFKGERYEKNTGLWAGRWDTYNRCLPCVNYCKILSSHDIEDDCGGIPFGCMWDMISDHGILYCPREGMPTSVLAEADREAIEHMQNQTNVHFRYDKDDDEPVWMGALFEHHALINRKNKSVPGSWELNSQAKKRNEVAECVM